MSKRMTLVEKLEQVIVEHNAEFNKIIKDATDHQNIAHTAILVGLMSAIKVAKQHNDWVSTDEQLPYAEEMLTNHYDPKEFYEIILKTGELLITSFTHLKNDGNNEIVFMDCTITLIDGEWKLLDDGYDVYEVDEVAYWKPIKSPKL